MHALIYLRVSTDRQAQKGLSIPAQKERCVQYAKDGGYEVDDDTDIFIDEGESARTSQRPQFQVLWERCRNDKTVRAIIFYDISRLARNRIDFALVKQDLTKRGIKLCSVTEGTDETPSGQLLEGVLSTVAEFFSLQGGEKIKMGMQQRAKGGWWPTKAPYGYKNVQERLSSGKVRSWLEVNWEEAKWVIRAFELFATGNYAYKTLSKQLAKEGFLVRKHKKSSGKLHASLMEQILRNKFYVGIIEWGGMIITDYKHELFLDRNVFEKVQAIIDARLGGGSRNRRLFSIIKPICWCGECGSKMTVEEHTLKNGELARYLRCLKSQHSERVHCGQVYGREDSYLQQFDGLLKQVQLPDTFVRKLQERIRTLFADEQKIYERGRADIENKLIDVRQQRKNLVLQLIGKNKTNQSDVELYDEIKTELEQKENSLNEELSNAESKIASVVKTVEITVSLATNCHYAYNKAGPELKALLARTFFKSITIKNKQITEVVLNEPLDYICRKHLQKYPVFNLTAVCESIVPS